MKHWDEKLGQSSILVLHPRTTPLVLLRRLLRLPDLDRSVKIQEAVMVSIIDALRRNSSDGHQLSNGVIRSPRQGPAGEMFPSWAFSSNGTSETILTWHVATSILEMRHQYHHGQGGQGSSTFDLNCKITATLLSRYCAYLMVWSPDLLPDDDEWSKSLYETVKKDAKRALTGRAALRSLTPPIAEYEQVAQLLQSVDSKYDVLKNGARLGKQLVVEGEERAWVVLSEFWSEMIQNVAPSDNIRGHLKAIARGGELITLLWAMLTHAGILGRPGDDAGGPATGEAGSAR